MDESHSTATAEAPAQKLITALQVTQQAPVVQAANGIWYAAFGDTKPTGDELARPDLPHPDLPHPDLPHPNLPHIVQAVPAGVAGALKRRAYYFVPLTIHENDEVVVSQEFTTELGDRATCHRNCKLGDAECTFISTRLMQDKFALAFEYFINVGHHFVEAVGVPESFHELAWSQAKSSVRGETSQDAWEYRQQADKGDEKARTQFFEAAFADVLAIYMLAMTVDFDYMDLREREYPLLAAPALAERLRHVAGLFPPNQGYEFEIRYRRRG